MSELKPCPFCGSGNVRVKCIEEFTYSAKCRQCDAVGPDAPTKEYAIDRWNGCPRAPASPVETLRDVFAMAAMKALLASRVAGEWPIGDVSEAAYQYADVMMKEREKADE